MGRILLEILLNIASLRKVLIIITAGIREKLIVNTFYPILTRGIEIGMLFCEVGLPPAYAPLLLD